MMRKRTDPIHMATVFYCNQCDIWGHPLRALWLSRNLILAEFDGCEHTAVWRIVDRDQQPAWVLCQATTKRGSPCKKASVDGIFCSVHAAQLNRQVKSHEG